MPRHGSFLAGSIAAISLCAALVVRADTPGSAAGPRTTASSPTASGVDGNAVPQSLALPGVGLVALGMVRRRHALRVSPPAPAAAASGQSIAAPV